MRQPRTRLMLRLTEIKLPLESTDADLRSAILQKLGIDSDDLARYTIFKQSYDARKRRAIACVYTLDIETPKQGQLLQRFQNDPHVKLTPDTTYRYVAKAPPQLASRPIVIGAGPCGLFAGLLLAQMGFRPLILERGKPVRDRSVDTFRFWSKGTFDPESNAQFGEGGAGTFSDGKLYSRIKDPKFRGRKVLSELVDAGAVPEILYLNKPHIGTYRLVKIVENLRHKITALGGEIRFQSRVEEIDLDWGGEAIRHWGGERRVRGVVLANGEYLPCDRVIVAVGHSARDTFAMLHQKGVYVEPKPFSIGFRVEHPQAAIDRARWRDRPGYAQLGAADYQLVHHCSNGRSVYSFCMCPGGQVVAATSEIGCVVTNGMSQYERSGKNANSGIVVGITPEKDYPGSPLAGIDLQRRLEMRAFELGGRTYRAPGQLVGDFLAGEPSRELDSVKPTYRPGVQLGDLGESLPDYAIAAIREAIPVFEQKIAGFARPDAIFTGVETRTSSPIRIKRGENYQSLNTPGLYPAGEGAGYAGGILSAAVDGIEVAEAVALAIVAEAHGKDGEAIAPEGKIDFPA